MKTISLCRRPGGCCPEAHISSDNSVTITDDYGGVVTLKEKEFEKLKKIKLDKQQKVDL